MEKRYYLKKIYIVTLISALLLSLMSCQKKEDIQVSNEKYTVMDFIKSVGSEDGSASDIYNLCYTNDKIYFLQSSYNETTEYYGSTIKSMDIEGTNVETVIDMASLEEEDGSSRNGNVQNYALDSFNNIWILLAEYPETEELDVDLSNTNTFKAVYYLDEYNTDNKRINHIDLSTVITATDAFVSFFKVTPSGNICISDNNNIYVLDNTGKLIYTEEASYVSSAATLGDSDIVYIVYDNSKNTNVIKQYNTSKGRIKKEAEINENYNFIATENETIYVGDNIGVYRYNIDKKKDTLIFKWMDMNINSNNVRELVALPDKKFLYSEFGKNTDNRLKLVTQDSSITDDERQTITLGCIYMDYDIQKYVVDFNKANTKYKIEIKEYTPDDTSEENDIYAKLNTEIISGKTLDLINIGGMPDISNYVQKNLFTDLNTYFEEDSNISKEDMVQSVLSSYETDGKLYSIPSNFEINTLAGNKEILGKSNNMTFAEVNEFAEENNISEIMQGVSQGIALQYALCTSGDSFIDLSNKTSSFDSGQFMSVLEYVNKFPIEYSTSDSISDYEKFMNNEVLFINAYLSKGTDYSAYRYLTNGNQVFAGFPSTDGNGHIISAITELAILEQSDNKDGAWEFIKYVLSKDVQDLINWGFPIRTSSLETKLEQATAAETTSDGEIYTMDSISADGLTIELTPITDEEVDELKDIINSLTHNSHYDNNILDIIKDEAAVYFAGTKKVEDVASAIQSRVQVYINEQK